MFIDSLTTIATIDLATVSGGQNASFQDYTDAQRGKVADAYKSVVCTTAGIKGAPDLAKGVYGTGASENDKIRASEMLKSYCNGGAQLPAQAPKSPF